MCSLQVFASSPDHPVWKRERLPHHGGAHRAHLDMQGDAPKPSRAFSQICDQCEAVGQAQRNSRWCRSSNACHSSSNFLPYQPRRSRASITAPLYKKRMMKTVGRATTNHLWSMNSNHAVPRAQRTQRMSKAAIKTRCTLCCTRACF